MFDQNCDFTKNFANIYTMKVTLIEGPITNSFAQKNPDISRTVKILGNQTLRDLHSAIFKAFDRTDEQLYEFQFETCPHEAGHTCYVLPTEMKDAFGTTILAGDVTRVTIDSLHLSVNECFGYWFDFGCDWLHTVRVQAIERKVPQDDYPITVDRIGKSPPEHPDWDDVIRY